MQNDNIGYLLHYVASILDRHSDQVLMERLGVSFSQFKILMVLSEADGSAQSHIAETLGQTEASISRQVRLMDKADLINVRRSTSNRRLRHIFLTKKGVALTEKSMIILNDYHQPMFETLSEKERQNLRSVLLKLKNYL